MEKRYLGSASILLAVVSIIGAQRIQIEAIRKLLPIILMYLVGVIAGVANMDYNYFRDLSYAAGLVALFYIGWSVEGSVCGSVFRAIIIVNPIISGYNLYKIIAAGDFSSLSAIRNSSVGVDEFAVGAVICLYYLNRMQIKGKVYKNLAWIGFILASTVTIITQSRTVLSEIVIFIYIFHFKKYRFHTKVIGFLILLTFVSFLELEIQINSDDDYSFIGKLIRSIDEIIPDRDAHVHLNWRSVESAIGIDHILIQPIVNTVFGNGFGFKLDLGFSMLLGTSEMDAIPIFHNGYIYIMLKYGLIGLCLFCYQIYILNKMSSGIRSANPFYFDVFRYSIFAIMLSQVFAGGIIQNSQVLLLLLVGSIARHAQNHNLSIASSLSSNRVGLAST